MRWKRRNEEPDLADALVTTMALFLLMVVFGNLVELI